MNGKYAVCFVIVLQPAGTLRQQLHESSIYSGQQAAVVAEAEGYLAAVSCRSPRCRLLCCATLLSARTS